MLDTEIVYRCSKCQALARQCPLAPRNSNKTIYWSDGKAEGTAIREQDALVSCPTCNTFLWLENLERVGVLGDPNASPSVEGERSNWASAPRFARLDSNGFAVALQEKLGDTLERERYLRTRLWWNYNDPHRRGITLGYSHALYVHNLQRLMLLLGDDRSDWVLRAEIARECGQFDRAVELCDSAYAMMLEPLLRESTGRIRAQAELRNPTVFRLLEDTPVNPPKPVNETSVASLAPDPMVDTTRTVEVDRTEVVPNKLTVPTFAESMGSQMSSLPFAVGWLLLLCATRYIESPVFSAMVSLLLLCTAILPLVFAYRFVSVVLMYPTIRATSKYRPIVNVVGALLLALIFPMIYNKIQWGEFFSFFPSGPFVWGMHTLRYIEANGFFVFKLIAWGLVIAYVTYGFGRGSRAPPFPSYPLVWYAALVISSLIVGAWARPAADDASRISDYSLEAYYVAPVAVAYCAYWLSIRLLPSRAR